MSVTTTVPGRKVTSIPAATLAEYKKSAFAVAGLADLALEQVKDAPAAYVAEVKKAQERLAEVPTVVKGIPAQVQSLRDEVETRVAKATEQANELYAALAVRGERLVTQIRRQPATEAAIVEGKEAVKKAEASVTAAKKSARAGEKAVQDAANKLG